MTWLAQADPVSTLFQQGTPLALLAGCAVLACIALWRTLNSRLEAERKEKEELRQELKDLNFEMRRYLLEQQLQQPRAQRLIGEAIDIVRDR